MILRFTIPVTPQMCGGSRPYASRSPSTTAGAIIGRFASSVSVAMPQFEARS
jgi:hypothetical protein